MLQTVCQLTMGTSSLHWTEIMIKHLSVVHARQHMAEAGGSTGSEMDAFYKYNY